MLSGADISIWCDYLWNLPVQHLCCYGNNHITGVFSGADVTIFSLITCYIYLHTHTLSDAIVLSLSLSVCHFVIISKKVLPW